MIVTAKQTKSPRTPASSGARRSASRAVRANAFPKSVRLLKHASFQQVYETGRKQFSASMIFFYVLTPVAEGAESRAQVGITVGRALGGAVDRNRIKRRMRDVVRHSLGNLKNALREKRISAEIVINPKRVALAADIAALRNEVERGFGVIAKANVSDNAAGANRAR